MFYFFDYLLLGDLFSEEKYKTPFLRFSFSPSSSSPSGSFLTKIIQNTVINAIAKINGSAIIFINSRFGIEK